jgi:hypothetical protein
VKKVVSVSLGSSKRDHKVKVEILGEKVEIKRVGTNGDFKKAIELLKEFDGKVDAIGLGGIDLYLWAAGKRYPIRDAMKLKNAVQKTPVVDGSGLKNTLERKVVDYLIEKGFNLRGKKVLMTSAVDRFGMAEALHRAGCEILFGDLIFGLSIPIPIRSFKTFTYLAKTLLPGITKMPFKVLYPTGEKQEEQPKPKYAKYYQEAEIIAGDFLFIRKFLPSNLKGKWILTNTVTSKDVEELKKRGLLYLITTTPEFEGRSFGTNVMEALLVALLKKDPEEISPQEYLEMLEKLKFEPRIEKLN